MSEKLPSGWRVIEGGKAQDVSAVQAEESKESPKAHFENTEEDELVALWIEVTGKPPHDWNESIKQNLLVAYSKQVRRYTVAQLRTALAAPDLWKRPSFARAITDEVHVRIKNKDFSPRP